LAGRDSMVWQSVGRFIWVPIAALVAALVSGFVLFTLGLERITQATQGKWDDADTLSGLFDLLVQGQALVTGLTVVPALAVIIIGEVARIRSAFYYVTGGGLALVAVPLLARYSDLSTIPSVLWQVFATAGFAGGWVYWLLAGRNA